VPFTTMFGNQYSKRFTHLFYAWVFIASRYTSQSNEWTGCKLNVQGDREQGANLTCTFASRWQLQFAKCKVQHIVSSRHTTVRGHGKPLLSCTPCLIFATRVFSIHPNVCARQKIFYRNCRHFVFPVHGLTRSFHECEISKSNMLA